MSTRPSNAAAPGRPPPRGRRPPDPTARARADELAARGMPIQMALAVAAGRIDLNEALQQLAQREEVSRLVEQHALSRALATQIVLQQAKLDDVLAARRLEKHRHDHRLRSVLDEHLVSGKPLGLLLHGKRRVVGNVLEVMPYEFRFKPEDGPEELIHKLHAKLAFEAESFKKVRKVVKFDKELEGAPRAPIERPKDRYGCSDRRLFRYLDEREEVFVTLLEGEQFKGTVEWFGRFEFGLHLKGETVVTVFRHALADVRLA